MAILMMLILFLNRRHPGALDNVSDLSKGRKLLAVLMLIIFITLPYTNANHNIVG